jgi:hypothetical protein
MADAKITRVPASGVSGTSEIDDNTDPSVLFESADGKDYLEIDTTDSAEKVILAAGGANVSIGSPGTSRTLSVGGEFRVEADGLNDFFQVANMSGAGSAGINGISQGDINFKLKSSNAYFGVLNDSATLFSVFQDAKITTNGETTALCDAGGIHILGSAGTANGGLDPGARLLVLEDNSSDGAGMSIVSDTTRKCVINFVDTHRRGWIQYLHNLDSMRVGAAGTDVLRINGVGLAVNAAADPASALNVIGSRTQSLTGTFTATNGDATISSGSSTSFLTELVPGSAIEIFEGSTSRGVYTVSSLTSATELELDSTVSGLSSSPLAGMTGKTDKTTLDVQTSDSQTVLKIPEPGRLEVLQASSLKYTNLIIGDSVTGEDLTNGFRNLFIGAEAGKEVTNNAGVICIGHSAGSYGTTADGMISIGYQSRGSAGGKTVILGRDAGSESGGQLSVIIGYRAGRIDAGGNTHYFGTNCTMIGAHTKPLADNNSNSIAIGYNAIGHGANTAVIGDANITQIDPHSDRGCNLGQVSYEFDAVHCVSVTEVSDERLKEQIEDTNLGVDFIKRLRPVSYKFKDRAAEYEAGTQTVTNENGEEVEEPVQVLRQPALTHARKHQGLIAQEVKQVLDDIGMDAADFGGYVDGNISGDGDRYALRYGQFIGPLIKAVQELTARIEELENGD